MNERFKQLAEQARIGLFEDKSFGWSVIAGTDQHLQKFAELIVKECLGCCEQVISDPVPESVDTWLNGGTQCMAEITKHFGVEE